jgi:hypothetical protein
VIRQDLLCRTFSNTCFFSDPGDEDIPHLFVILQTVIIHFAVPYSF